MIQLHSQHSMVVGRDGQRRSFSFEDVRADVIQALRTCGSEEIWIAEHVLLVVEEHLVRRRGRGKSIHETDVDRLVSDVLVASGYKDVARAYEERRGLDPVEELTATLAVWDRDRVRRTLLEALPLSEAEAESVTEGVVAALTVMGFGRVSDSLIRELGIHVLCGEGAPGRHGDEAPSEFLLTEPALAARIGLAGTPWERDRIVRIRPVSRLFPRVCVDVHMAALCGSLGGQNLTEMVLLPRVRSLCRFLTGILREARRCVGGCRADVLDVPAHVVIHGLDVTFERCMGPMGKRARRECDREIRSWFELDVASAVEFDLIVTYR